MHLAVLCSLESEYITPDNVLCGNIKIWEYKLSQEDTDKLTKAVLQAVLYVAKELANQRGIVVLGATVMAAPTCLKVQSQTTRIRMTNLMPKVRRQARRIRTHNAQVALRMKRRLV